MAVDTMVVSDRALRALHAGALSEEQARQIVAIGPKAAVFALLELSEQLAEQRAKTAAESHQTPATPSGMKPPYQKPPGKLRKRRSAFSKKLRRLIGDGRRSFPMKPTPCGAIDFWPDCNS